MILYLFLNILFLIKVGKGGIIKDPEVHQEVCMHLSVLFVMIESSLVKFSSVECSSLLCLLLFCIPSVLTWDSDKSLIFCIASQIRCKCKSLMFFFMGEGS